MRTITTRFWANSACILFFACCMSVSMHAQEDMRIRDLSIDELAVLANGSYLVNGSTIITAELIYTGLRRDPLNIDMLRSLADFLTERNNEVAAVVYFYLYDQKDRMNESERNTFIIMFPDAMYQFRLSKPKDGRARITLRDIAEYNDFIFDIDGLQRHTEMMIKDFGSIENFLKIIGSTIGVICGFIDRNDNADFLSLMPENVKLNETYYSWMDSWPKEIEDLVKQL